MSTLTPITFKPKKAKKELKKYLALLRTRHLGEKKHILPFFAKHRQMAALAGCLFPEITNFDRIKTEWNVFDGLRADLVVGDSKKQAFIIVEFEDGRKNSLFKGKRRYPEWSQRYEHGFSQIIDWVWKIAKRDTDLEFQTEFGSITPKFHFLLVVGRIAGVATPREQHRLSWRNREVIVGGRRVECITFDELAQRITDSIEFAATIAQVK